MMFGLPYPPSWNLCWGWRGTCSSPTSPLLEYAGKELLSLTTGTKHGEVFKVLAAASGRLICYLVHMSMLEFKEDLLHDLLQRAGSGRIFVLELSSKGCLEELWGGKGLIKSFVVRGNPRWHRALHRFKGSLLDVKARLSSGEDMGA